MCQSWITFNNPTIRVAELKNWARRLDLSVYRAHAEKIIGLQYWVNRLENREAGEIIRELSVFCKTAGFDMEWLSQALQASPPGPQGTDMLVFFCLALYERHINLAMASLQQWEKAPETAANQEFGWQLYLRMIESRMVEPAGELLFDSAHDRYQIVCSAIQLSLQKDYLGLVSLVQDILSLKQMGRLPRKTTKINGLRFAMNCLHV